MKVVLRADAGAEQGVGHVMRCLTLAEELVRRRHDVTLVSAASGIDWLGTVISETGVTLVEGPRDELDAGLILEQRPDRVVVDSYRIDAAAISAFAVVRPVLAIVDGDARGIEASLVLEQNFGSEDDDWSTVRGTVLAGASYSLIRDDILARRREDPWRIAGVPRVTAFMGGTDATGTIVDVTRQIAPLDRDMDLTIVAPVRYHADVLSALKARSGVTILAPTPELPALLGASDLVVSAAGTSAWDLCTLGIPTVLVGVIDNQSAPLSRVLKAGLALGVDLTTGGPIEDVATELDALLSDAELRRAISSRANAVFDGLGKVRVADALEARGPSSARL